MCSSGDYAIARYGDVNPYEQRKQTEPRSHASAHQGVTPRHQRDGLPGFRDAAHADQGLWKEELPLRRRSRRSPRPLLRVEQATRWPSRPQHHHREAGRAHHSCDRKHRCLPSHRSRRPCRCTAPKRTRPHRCSARTARSGRPVHRIGKHRPSWCRRARCSRSAPGRRRSSGIQPTTGGSGRGNRPSRRQARDRGMPPTVLSRPGRRVLGSRIRPTGMSYRPTDMSSSRKRPPTADRERMPGPSRSNRRRPFPSPHLRSCPMSSASRAGPGAATPVRRARGVSACACPALKRASAAPGAALAPVR